jgi:hypothetical protein
MKWIEMIFGGWRTLIWVSLIFGIYFFWPLWRDGIFKRKNDDEDLE